MSAWQKLGWYARRFSVMGPAEIACRAGEALTLQGLRLRAATGRPFGAPEAGLSRRAAFCLARAPQLPELDWDFDPADPAIAELLQGRLMALGRAWHWSGEPQAWHRAPDTGATWPQRFFGAIAYRGGNPYGDVRVAWEPARLQWLVDVALVARAADAERSRLAVGLLEDALLSWVASNPPLIGIHYISSMECALRLIAVCHAVDIAREHLQRREEVFDAVTRLVSSHATLIGQRLSLHSSAGNHTVAECAGLIYAGELFSEMPQAARWKERGLRILCAEAGRQILDDGGGIEQAFWYLRFIAELVGLVVALQRHRGLAPAPVLEDRLARAQEFLGAMTGASGRLPPVGDADDGYALSPRLRAPRGAAARMAGIHTFPDAGYSLLAQPGEKDTVLLLDHGPLGMPPLFGHGHADALSLLMWVGGQGVLIDTGTYTYLSDPEWRRYFRSTAAHNTICVDGMDQSVQETALMWSAPACGELLRVVDDDAGRLVLARHRGYSRLGGVVHWRGIALRPGGAVLVWDRLTGDGEHGVELNWHLGQPAQGEGRRWRLGADLILEIEGAQAVGCRYGGESAGPGWRSASYGQKEPIHMITAACSGPLPCEFLSRFFRQGIPMSAEQAHKDIATFRHWTA